MKTANITHAGSVAFKNGAYARTSGTNNWTTAHIAGFPGLPLGMVRIRFAKPLDAPYAVVVTATRNPNAPLMSANYGDAEPDGFVVHLWETVADRTVQNGGFSFIVLAGGGV